MTVAIQGQPASTGVSFCIRIMLRSEPRKCIARGSAMVRCDVRGHHADGRGEHGRVIGEAENRHHVGQKIERQDEIGAGAAWTCRGVSLSKAQ